MIGMGVTMRQIADGMMPQSQHIVAFLFNTLRTQSNRCIDTLAPLVWRNESTIPTQCRQHSGMDAAMDADVPTAVHTFFVLLRQSTKNVAAALDFCRNQGLRRGENRMTDASILSDWHRVAATCRAWCCQAKDVQQRVGQFAFMATMYVDTKYSFMGGHSCVLQPR